MLKPSENLLKKLSAVSLGAFLTCIMIVSNHAQAMSDQALFQHARDSYAAKNEIALAEDVNQLKLKQYLLAPYADYWLMLLRLSQADNLEVQAFLTQYADMPFSERLRGEWLKKLGKQQDWSLFLEQYASFKRDDQAVQCYALLGKSQYESIDVSEQVRALWLTTADLPSNCSQLFDFMQKSEVLTSSDIWARYRMALQEGKLSLAKSIASRLSEIDDKDLKLLDFATQNPRAVLENKPVVIKVGRKTTSIKMTASFQTPAGVEANLYALDRLTRINLADAVAVFSQVQNKFTLADRAFAYGRIAYHAARAHDPNALKYYTLANDASLDKEQLAWKVRAALRASDWDAVLTAIASMQPEQQQEAAWRYWKARALKEQHMQAEANVILGPLSKERHYYGWLAAEELESLIGNVQEQYSVTDTEVMAIASQPAIKRVTELQKLDMRWEAKAEWVWLSRGFDDKQLLAAAEFAARQKWYDIAISTADNTKQLHDFNLRYPTPYRDTFRSAARNEGVDEAWIYGLTRQESRFMHYAKSGVGASGLMQLMPTTAKWAAKKMGLNGYSNDAIHDLNTNVSIGTYYMRYTLELLNGQAVLATAAYNAGPSRAKRWMAKEPLEAAVYIESIPFVETRTYVQKVMANAQMYAPRLGLAVQSLKSRLGIVPANGKSEAVLADNE